MTQNADRPHMVPDASTSLAAERTRLAHERTLLAWTRTATALITFGFGIHQVFRALRGASNESKGLIGPREIGLLMIFSGLAALFLAVVQNRNDMRALRAQYPHLTDSSARFLATLISGVGLLAFAVMLYRE